MSKVTCKKCGWVYFQVSREYAEKEVSAFNKYFNSLTKKEKSHYSGKSNIYDYEYCHLCKNSYKNFRRFKKDDCPDGCTLSPIIDRKE